MPNNAYGSLINLHLIVPFTICQWYVALQDWLLEALEAGWNQLIERHESLRTVFHEVNGQPVQQIEPYAFQSIPKTDLTMLSSEDQEEEVKRLIQQETEVPFDLTEGPLIRTSILHVGEEEWILLCTLHHIISDGWSMGILLEEWMAFYEKQRMER